MNDLLKWLRKTIISAICWVFLLSLNISGRSLFSYANEILVQNQIIRAVDAELSDLWTKTRIAVKNSLNDREDAKEML